MIDTIYIEDAISSHPRTTSLLARFPAARQVRCERHAEIFNRKSQSFRLQKSNPALILAEKRENFLIPAPDGYHIGCDKNFYFSHMLNCLYDCRYCFLQGMYRSAHYVLFVNYEDFQEAIETEIGNACNEPVHFFSGYDCDSLAFEPVSKFADFFTPVFAKYPQALLELRTKSTQVRSLLNTASVENIVVAFSLSPDNVARALEHRAPGVGKRLEAIEKLQSQGWKIGLRFDPVIYQDNFKEIYGSFFEEVFSRINPACLHSVSIGTFRLPKNFFNTLSRIYPEEKLFASPVEDKAGMMSYSGSIEEELLDYCTNTVLKYIPDEKLFPCSY